MLHDTTLMIGGEQVLSVTADHGRTFRVRLVMPGETYGVSGGLTAEQAMIEFYDATFAGDVRFGPLGQFVSRYHLHVFGTDELTGGLDLYGGEPAWKIDGRSLARACGWAGSQVNRR